MHRIMLLGLFANLLGRRRARSPSAPAPAKPDAASAPRPAPVSAARTAPSLSDMLDSLIEGLGGPELEIEPSAWLDLAEQVAQVAESMPPPPSFPRIATQVLAAARDPEVDINELVGLVQRDGALASSLVRTANSPALAPAVPVTSLRGAIQSLGIARVVELVVGTAGRSYYQVASSIELALFPALWPPLFNDAMANGFSAGRLALDVPASRGDNALFAGLLCDVGRPIALRILGSLVSGGAPTPSDPLALAVLDEAAAGISARAIAEMNLPEELRAACILDPDQPTADAVIARLISSIGAIQRRSPRILDNAGDARLCAEQLRLGPYALRSLFAQRTEYVREAAELFAG